MAHQVRGTAAPLLGVDLGEAAGRLADVALPVSRNERNIEEARPELLDLASVFIEEIERYLGWFDSQGAS